MTALSRLAGKNTFALGLLLLMGFTSPRLNQATEAPATQVAVQAPELEGAWRFSSASGKEPTVPAGATAVRIMEDGLFSVAVYDKDGKKFLGTYGGTYTLSNGKLTEQYEFNTLDSTAVGKTATGAFTLQKDNLQLRGLKEANASETWQKIEAGNTASPLAGAWRITAREGRDGQMNAMPQGPRKTIKMLSDDRFQWIAFNSETAEFFGTGGGTYTAKDGKYTENIEFFSRDSSRVGKQLTFDYDVKGNEWHHSGLSSTGNKINEVWQRQTNQ